MVEIEKTFCDTMSDGVRDNYDAYSIDLEYPRHNRCKYVMVGLCCVRAADSILIGYDFDRDGYVIHQQPSEDNGNGCMTVFDGWQEVAFIPAWQLDKRADQ